jgi:hypothetical protein
VGDQPTTGSPAAAGLVDKLCALLSRSKLRDLIDAAYCSSPASI